MILFLNKLGIYIWYLYSGRMGLGLGFYIYVIIISGLDWTGFGFIFIFAFYLYLDRIGLDPVSHICKAKINYIDIIYINIYLN